ncbi:MAG TPA: MarR family transcriptional regulator [Candidatus Merdivicinus faecavium]|nr:MarR family transcriptional regulator [Candidatus Merdivicinus faecavium]
MDSFMRCISRTARCAQLYRSERFEELGLNGGQYIYITCACRSPGISQEQMARQILVNKSNVCRQLAQLEQNGFIRREPDTKDRRVLRVYPTEKAEKALPLIQRVLADWRDYLTDGFTEQERETLDALLERVLERAAAYAENRLAPDRKEEKP